MLPFILICIQGAAEKIREVRPAALHITQEGPVLPSSKQKGLAEEHVLERVQLQRLDD